MDGETIIKWIVGALLFGPLIYKFFATSWTKKFTDWHERDLAHKKALREHQLWVETNGRRGRQHFPLR